MQSYKTCGRINVRTVYKATYWPTIIVEDVMNEHFDELKAALSNARDAIERLTELVANAPRYYEDEE